MYIMTDCKLSSGIDVKFWRVGAIKIDSLGGKVYVEALGYNSITHYIKNRQNGTLKTTNVAVKCDWEKVIVGVGDAKNLEELIFTIAYEAVKNYNPIMYDNNQQIVSNEKMDAYRKYFSVIG